MKRLLMLVGLLPLLFYDQPAPPQVRQERALHVPNRRLGRDLVRRQQVNLLHRPRVARDDPRADDPRQRTEQLLGALDR